MQGLPLIVQASAGVERLFHAVAIDADIRRDGAVEVIAVQRLASAEQAEGGAYLAHRDL
ncbi:hypothetical protein D9M73_267670 [compost metagenome]